MSRTVSIALVVVAVLVGVVAWSSTYVVDKTEQVVVTQFGDPIGEPILEPGLYFKAPFVQTVHRFDKRYLEWNGDVNEIPTKDKRFIEVDTFARWHITEPLEFYQRLRDEDGAQSRLDDIIDGATRDAVASHDLLEVVRASNRDAQATPELGDDSEGRLEDIEVGRPTIMDKIEENIADQTGELGLEVLDMRFKRINYNDQVRERVFDRMIAERQRIAKRYRSEGKERAAEIRGEKEKKLDELQSEADRKAEKLRGEADAEATAIYAEAYQKDPKFYEFLRTMESYRETLGGKTWLLMSTQADFFKYLKESGYDDIPAEQ